MTTKPLPKPSNTNKQVQEYLTAVRKGMSSYFVMQMSEGWKVQPALEPSKSKNYESKEEALLKARAEAKDSQGAMFVFDKNGSLIEED